MVPEIYCWTLFVDVSDSFIEDNSLNHECVFHVIVRDDITCKQIHVYVTRSLRKWLTICLPPYK